MPKPISSMIRASPACPQGVESTVRNKAENHAVANHEAHHGNCRINSSGNLEPHADGLVYVALEDKNEVRAFDPKTLEVKRHIPLEVVTAPTGLAIDRKNDRIFVGGHNKMAEVIDGASGKMIASFATGSGTDAAGWDGKDGLAFISKNEGMISVIREKSANEFVALGLIPTQQSAKTMAYDKKTGKIFLPAATVIVTPPADPSQKPKRTITEGTFAVLVVGK